MTKSPPRSREWDSAAYDRISAPQFSWGKKVLDRVALRGDETVLDAGCGTGRLTSELLERLPGGHVIALDLSENMLRAARENLSPRFADRVRFVAADLLHLPFKAAFHGIFSTAVFHWVTDHESLFRRLYEVLRPEGWLVAQCGGGPNLERLLTRVSMLSQRDPYAPYLGAYRHSWEYSDAETASRRLRAAGFADVETSLEPAPTRFDCADQFIEFVSKVILHRHLEQIPDKSLHQGLLNEVAELAAHDNPPFELDYWRLNLKGHRAARRSSARG
jgi:trans-aconitate methyltransferase